MIRMICRNKVRDFAHWKSGFDSHTAAHRDAGLTLEGLWRSLDDPHNVFFIFQVADLEKAKSFVSAPEAAQAGAQFGVLEGDVWFVGEDTR